MKAFFVHSLVHKAAVKLVALALTITLFITTNATVGGSHLELDTSSLPALTTLKHLRVTRLDSGNVLVSMPTKAGEAFEMIIEKRTKHTLRTIFYVDGKRVKESMLVNAFKVPLLNFYFTSIGSEVASGVMLYATLKEASAEMDIALSPSLMFALKKELKLAEQLIGLDEYFARWHYVAIYSGPFQFCIVWLLFTLVIELAGHMIKQVKTPKDIKSHGASSENDAQFYEKIRAKTDYFTLLGFAGSLVGLIMTGPLIAKLQYGAKFDAAITLAELASAFSLALTTTLFGIGATLIVSRLTLIAQSQDYRKDK